MYHFGSSNRLTDEVYKSTKLSTNGDVKTNGRAVEDDQIDQDEILAGPEMPPEDEEEPDDEEGRFFGGGITRDTKDVLDFIDERDKVDIVRNLATQVTGHADKIICRSQRRLIKRGCEDSP